MATERALPYTQQVKRDLTEQIERLQGLDEVQKGFLRLRWLDQVLWMEQGALRSQRRYYALRLVTILGGVAIPALVGLDIGDGGEDYLRWLAFALGLLVAAAAALEEFFRYGERWRHYRQTVEFLKSEGWGFFQLAGPAYAEFASHADAFRTFAVRVEDAFRQEVDVYITQVVRERTDQGRAEQTRSDGASPPDTELPSPTTADGATDNAAAATPAGGGVA
jgi:hypothetical protein